LTPLLVDTFLYRRHFFFLAARGAYTTDQVRKRSSRRFYPPAFCEKDSMLARSNPTSPINRLEMNIIFKHKSSLTYLFHRG
jgi:hypothetical protein